MRQNSTSTFLMRLYYLSLLFLLASAERIAIIGAGAGGSSAAHYLQKYTSHSYDITIFERADYIGGRSSTVENYARSNVSVLKELELGASVFIKENRILYHAASEFGLALQPYELKNREGLDSLVFDGSLGFWDGKEFAFYIGPNESNAVTAGKLFIKYGFSPAKVIYLVKSIMKQFVSYFYEYEFPFRSFYDVIELSELDHAASIPADVFLGENGVRVEYSKDIIEAATRSIYSSNVRQIHGIGAAISLASEDAVQVVGGNYQIFENFIKSSNAELKLSTLVNKLIFDGTSWTVVYDDNKNAEFDQVIIAAPLVLSEIQVVYNGEVQDNLVKEVEYQSLWVTFVSSPRSTGVNNHLYFGERIPQTILSTTPKGNSLEPPFFSFSVGGYNNVTDEVIYKVFSKEKITDEILLRYFFNNKDDFEILFRKLWRPFPKLVPATHFDELQILDNLWYLNGFETFISTMETSALAGASVAGIISLGKNTVDIVVP